MKFELQDVALAVSILAIMVLAAATLRRRVRFLRSLFIPNAIVAGAMGLILGPQVIGKVVDDGRASEGLFGATTVEIWNEFPGLLINVVFACVLLGKRLPAPRTLWNACASQTMFGFTLSFGQYALGMALAAAVLVPVFGMSEMSGALLEISFTGGHGTAAGLSKTMSDADFAEGADLALGLATIGLLSGLLAGTLLINRAVRSDSVAVAREQEVPFDEPHELGRRPVPVRIPESDQPDPATSPLTLTIGAIATAIVLGYLIQQLLIGAELLITGGAAADSFIGDVPLFPFTIIGGAIVQVVLTIFKWSHLISLRTVNHASGLALDLLIAAAIATLSLSTLGNNAIPVVLMALVAIGWSTAALIWLAPLFYGERWFERAIGDFGQSSGTVASGFMLIDMSDPDHLSGARDSYGYKQLLFEPFLGGGLITALAIPMIARVGLGPALAVSGVLTALFIALGVFQRRRAST